MVVKGGVASYVDKPSKLIWNIPDHWSLQDAATVPVVYITVYYAFFMATDIRKGKSILIHAGTGGIGLAAIRVALAYNLDVYTTCSTPLKKKFLLDTFPQLEGSHIGNSRDTSFEQMIQCETDGKGVDFVLNSLSEDKLLASVRCLGQSGHFLEIGKFDMANDTKLGLGCFLKELTFHAVLADSLLGAPDDHIWPHMTYVIPGGLGGFGLELADWMCLRGARKLVLSSSRGITKDYQSFRIALWKTYGCEVVVNTADISTVEGCRNLLVEAAKLGSIGGIFNLAVALRDGIFANQNMEQFVQSFSPKAVATKHLDALSRTLCPELDHFVVFSSVSCGRGNAGQTNYGMANSVMERIIEGRSRDGLPAKAIQWGAVGEVGLVADMAEDKIDLEIGGTLQQRISSCLQELDTLLSAKSAVVASMVVAEKRSGRSGNESIIDTVMHIMGIRDLKSVSLGTTLSEMGMDSLMSVEIKQTLERDFELVMTPQDLRSLTVQKLHEIMEAREKDNSDAVKMILASEGKLMGIELLLRNFGDEAHSDQIMYSLQTHGRLTKQNFPPSIIIPGIEGTAGQAWYNIGAKLNSRANVLQLHQFAQVETINDIGQQTLEHVKALLKPTHPFYLIGYSYGSYVALQLAALLEQLGYRGHVLLIDGAPHFLTKLTNLHLGENFTDNSLYDLLFSSIVNQIFPEETKESISAVFHKLDTLKEKMDLFIKYVDKQNIYSKEYFKVMIEALFRRVKIAAKFDLNSIRDLKSPIMLVRPAEVSLKDIEEDYCVSQLTSGKVTLKVIEGNHSTMLENPVLPQIINDFDPGLLDDKNFEEYIRDGKPVAVA
ncbi:GH19665 [Drosophila grimshawi]|uniref:Fatty acid synthase n=1 Tax=Drosophila grimshawi TaxID=7222 RepID=B4K107_DROGR|nr:GH19665 [Drosophila grimshawi]